MIWSEVVCWLSTYNSVVVHQVILVASSFMNPVESRASQNLNRVRIFSSDQLSKAVAGQKWDRAKVVCTQQFNQVLKMYCSHCTYELVHCAGNVISPRCSCADMNWLLLLKDMWYGLLCIVYSVTCEAKLKLSLVTRESTSADARCPDLLSLFFC